MSYPMTSSMQRNRAMTEDRLTEDRLKFPEWQEPLRLAMLEQDPILLAEKTQIIESTLRERLHRLRAAAPGQDSDQSAEEQALIDALNIIRVLRNNVA